MNSLQINKAVYKIQDLVIQNKMPSFKNFKNKIQTNFMVIFSSNQLEKIYAFIETIQKHSKQKALALALKPMFKMLLKTMINNNDLVNVYHMKTKKSYTIEFKNITPHFKRKIIIRAGVKTFIIPFKPNTTVWLKKEMALLNLMNYNSLKDSFNLYEHEQDQNGDE